MQLIKNILKPLVGVSLTTLSLSALCTPPTVTAYASVGGLGKAPDRLATQLSSQEIAREGLDLETYPHFMKFLKGVRLSDGMHPTDPKNASWLNTSKYFTPTAEMWDDFLKSAIADRLTNIRAFVLLGREVKRLGIPMFGSGEVFRNAIHRNRINLGLSMPAKNVAAAIWYPDARIQDPEFLIHVKIFYTEPYVHQFPDEILPANLKIGFEPPESYWMNGKEFRHPWISADLYYGPKNGVGFRNVKGVGGQKRGVMGFFQKVLFFLPDAVDSMIIREESGEMVTEALVNTVVKDFEKNPLYSIHQSEILTETN